ncbi:hypothetical protein A2112_00270 [Candidatus Woesebacteria bacterium GWA1_42_12]|nr:MAG: hypothetical protein A2112_00270 [Candidatus Woesebacteria bacterium GWA1_42_12]
MYSIAKLLIPPVENFLPIVGGMYSIMILKIAVLLMAIVKQTKHGVVVLRLVIRHHFMNFALQVFPISIVILRSKQANVV